MEQLIHVSIFGKIYLTWQEIPSCFPWLFRFCDLIDHVHRFNPEYINDYMGYEFITKEKRTNPIEIGTKFEELLLEGIKRGDVTDRLMYPAAFAQHDKKLCSTVDIADGNKGFGIICPECGISFEVDMQDPSKIGKVGY